MLAVAACGRIGFDALPDDGDAASNVPVWGSGTRLRAMVADFGDGNRELVDWFDSQLGSKCVSTPTSAGRRHCLPIMASAVYADAGCTSRLGYWPDASGPLPAWLISYEQTPCQSVGHIFPLAAEVAPPTMYFIGGPTSCLGPYAAPGQQRYFQVGAELDPSSEFVEIRPSIVGTGRLRENGWEASDGSFERRELLDTDIGLTCSMKLTTDGVRCLPTGAPTSAFYADAGCTQQLVDRRCTQSPFVTTVTGCGPVHVFDATEPWTGQVYSMTGTCQPATADRPLASVQAEVPEARFVSAVAVTEVTGGRLDRVSWHALDGGRARRDYFDTQRGEPCGYSVSSQFGYHCLPTQVALSTGDYGDASCSQTITALDPSCPMPDYIYGADSRGIFLHLVDKLAAQPTQHFNYLGSCNNVGLDLTKTYLTGAIEVLDLDTWAKGNETLE